MTPSTSTRFTGCLRRIRPPESTTKVVLSLTQEAHSQPSAPNLFPASLPATARLCSSFPFPAQRVPGSPKGLLSKHTAPSHAFAVLFLLPRNPGHLSSLLSSQISTSSRCNPKVTFSEKFSLKPVQNRSPSSLLP